VDGFLGSEADFSRFYREHVDGVLIFFTRRCFDAQVALDLTAETFAQAFASRRGFRGGADGEAAAWLFAIARRQLREHRDGNRRRPLLRLDPDRPQCRRRPQHHRLAAGDAGLGPGTRRPVSDCSLAARRPLQRHGP
jgi:DNA-directed RNA polymerase specialized sigma24 family protein